jgi:hypothetical protein
LANPSCSVSLVSPSLVTSVVLFREDFNVCLPQYVTQKGHVSSSNYSRVSIFVLPESLIYYFFVFLVLPVESKRKHDSTVTACCYWKEAEVTLDLAALFIQTMRLSV